MSVICKCHMNNCVSASVEALGNRVSVSEPRSSDLNGNFFRLHNYLYTRFLGRGVYQCGNVICTL